MTTVLVAHPGAELFGSDRMLLESVIGFVEIGARVVVALPNRGPLDADLRAAGAEVVIIPMLVLRKSLLKPRSWPTLLRDAFRGLVAAWRLIGRVRPDVVYVSTIILPEWPVVARLRRTRTVSHVHEAEAAGSRLINIALYLPHLASHRTIVNSRFSLETIRTALPALAERSHVVYNGVASPSDPTPPRAHLDGQLRILYVGRLSPRKGVDLVIEAARLLREQGTDASVTLLGAVFEGYEWYEQQLREQARSSGIQVDFAGFNPEIWPFISGADVLVVPSRVDEPFGNTAVEGILALRPVAASDSGGLREAAGGYQTAALSAPDEPESLAHAIRHIAERWDDMVLQLDASRAQALRRHAPEAYRESVANVVVGVMRCSTNATPPRVDRSR